MLDIITSLPKVSTPRAFVIESDHESSDTDIEMPPATSSVPVSLPEDHHHPGYVPIRLYLIMQKLEMVLSIAHRKFICCSGLSTPLCLQAQLRFPH